MANTLQEAFKAYKKDFKEDAARCLSQAIEHYLQKTNFRRAATQKQVLADFYKEKKDNRNARLAYAEAAQLYEDDNAPSLATKLNIEAAELAALDNDYLDAIKRFEHSAKKPVSSTAMKYFVKKYLWQAGICHLALDLIGAQRALQSYWEIDPEFPSSDDGQLLACLLELAEQGDSVAFQAKVDQVFGVRGDVRGLRSSGHIGSWNDIILTR